MVITAVLSAIGAVDVVNLPTGGIPVRLMLVTLVLAVGLGMTVALDRPRSRPYWQMALATVVVLLPLLALQAAASRVPFVALSRGSAGVLLWLTLATAATLIAFWLFAAFQSSRSPEDGALLFLPAAVLVPAVIGAPGSLEESSALATLAVASLVAGTAIFLGSLAPRNWRPIAGGLALGAQFVLLWTLGRGPVIGHDAGTIVPFSAAMLLAETALLTVLTPLAALFSGRLFDTIEEESGERRRISVPAKGARRHES
jgi:hypothetical protein